MNTTLCNMCMIEDAAGRVLVQYRLRSRRICGGEGEIERVIGNIAELHGRDIGTFCCMMHGAWTIWLSENTMRLLPINAADISRPAACSTTVFL